MKQEGLSVTLSEIEASPLLKLWKAKWDAWTQSYDVLFTQKFNPITLSAILIARLRGKKVLVDWDDLDEGLQSNIFKQWIARTAEKMGPSWSHHISTHSSIIQERLKREHRAYTVIPQGFNETLFHALSPEEKGQAKERWGLQHAEYVVGHLCTFTHGGTLDLDVILDAWGKMDDSKIFFLLIGGGPLEPQIKKQIQHHGLEDRVKITGLLPQAEIPSALGCLDVSHVFMRDHEANRARVSFKVIESIAMGIPVVGSLVGASLDLFKSYVISANAESFVSRTMETLQTPPEYDRETFRKRFGGSSAREPLLLAIQKAISDS